MEETGLLPVIVVLLHTEPSERVFVQASSGHGRLHRDGGPDVTSSVTETLAKVAEQASDLETGPRVWVLALPLSALFRCGYHRLFSALSEVTSLRAPAD